MDAGNFITDNVINWLLISQLLDTISHHIQLLKNTPLTLTKSRICHWLLFHMLIFFLIIAVALVIVKKPFRMYVLQNILAS